MEAVIGVLGVFAFPLGIGGVDRPAASVWALLLSCSAATLATVGVLRGNKFKGGSRKGCRFRRLLAGVAVVLSASAEFLRKDNARVDWKSRSALADRAAGVAAQGPSSAVLVPVSVLESSGRLDFRAAKYAGADDSLGDSYALGIAGTGGTSSSSPSAELCTFLGLGVGSLDVEMLWLSRCGRAPFDVRAEALLVFDDNERPEL